MKTSLKIEKPGRHWYPFLHNDSIFQEWWKECVSPVNEMLEAGVEVSGCIAPGDDGYHWSADGISRDTHRALLINVTSINKETREEKLERLVSQVVKENEEDFYEIDADDWFKEAKAVLDGGEG